MESIPELLKHVVEIEASVCLIYQKTSVDLYDFEPRQYFRIKPVLNGSALPAILRIGAIGNYETLYNSLADYGLTLVNSIEAHNKASLLPHWYPLVSQYTMRTKWYETVPDTGHILNDFEFPVFIKGERQTNRHKKSLSVARNTRDLQYILQQWHSDPVLNWQRITCREFVALEQIGTPEGDELPFSKEFRVFLWKNQVIGIGQYWTQAPKITLTDLEFGQVRTLAQLVSEQVGVPFLVVDIAKKAAGDWIVIELNDAQESGFAGVNKLNLWENLINIEQETSII